MSEIIERLGLLQDQLAREQAAVDAITDWSDQHGYGDGAGSPRMGEAIDRMGWPDRWVWQEPAKTLLIKVRKGRERFESD